MTKVNRQHYFTQIWQYSIYSNKIEIIVQSFHYTFYSSSIDIFRFQESIDTQAESEIIQPQKVLKWKIYVFCTIH